MKLDEIDPLYEMSGFKSKTTGLPANIEIWTRTEPRNHGHSRYRVKVKKDREWAATFLVGSDPKMIDNYNHSLLGREIAQIQQFIIQHKSALINLIDDKIDSAECGIAVMKRRGEVI